MMTGILILYIKKKKYTCTINVMEDLKNDFDWTRNKLVLIWNLDNY